jgi:TM2 domain-containing membrane protein YozV
LGFNLGGALPQTTFSEKDYSMAGQGSAGNVIAAAASFFIPGLGQLLQGRLGMAIIQFVLAIVLWIFLLGWAIHLWSIIDAALWKPPATTA